MRRLLLILAACGAPHSEPDASTPIEEIDASVDAGEPFDAGHDIEPDAGRTDAGHDAGVELSDAGPCALPSLDWRSASTFAVLVGRGLSGTPDASIVGDVEALSGQPLEGFPPGSIQGRVHVGGAIAQLAHADMGQVYFSASHAPCAQPFDGGSIVYPGVYEARDLRLRSLQLDGDGVYIFRVRTLTVEPGSSLYMRGAKPENVLWIVELSASFGADAGWSGSIVAQSDVTLSNATLKGRVASQIGFVRLENSQVTR